MCAEIFGIPRRVARRAQFVRSVVEALVLAVAYFKTPILSQLLATHELGQLFDEEMTDDERRDLKAAEEVCRQFLAWNLMHDGNGEESRRDVKQVLEQVLGRTILE